MAFIESLLKMSELENGRDLYIYRMIFNMFSRNTWREVDRKNAKKEREKNSKVSGLKLQ